LHFFSARSRAVRCGTRLGGFEVSGVNIQGLSIKFGANEVIKGLDLQVQEGEFLVLLGPSGCGKSTLLHAIAGLIDVSGGRIEIGGQDMTDAEPSERGIGMVFQSYALYPTMSVERNMSFGLRVAGVAKAEIEKRVQRAAEMLQLTPLLSRKPAQLSGGQRQRVAIGRALVRQAGVFLFDEPLSNLDAKLRAELRRELKLLHQTLGNTMVYVTHDQVEAMTLASRIVVMKGGVIQQIGTPTEVYERPANLFVAGFLGAPAINLLPAEVKLAADGSVTLSGALPVTLPAPLKAPLRNGQAVVLGVRPEHLHPCHDGRWAATVQLVEPMGNHQVVWLQLAGQTLSTLVHDGRVIRAGDTLRFDLDEAALSLFDAGSEERL
jgi:multiple sugar transport system ATP-binding protein